MADGIIHRVGVVLNAKSGAMLDQPGQSVADRLAAALEAAGLQASFIPPEPGTLPERIERALGEQPDAILVAGGDGTVACAAQVLAGKVLAGKVLAGQDVPLALLPLGTMNLLAKDVGLPLADVDAVVRAIAGGQRRAIDVGDVNGAVFLCASMLGLPAQLGRHREASRGSTLRLWTRMARATWHLLSRGRRLRVRVTVDGRQSAMKASALTITVGPVDEAGGRSFGRSCLDGGLLSLYVAPRLRLRDLLRLGMRAALGNVRADSAVHEHQAREVDIAGGGRAMRVMNDGELVLLTPPLRYRVRPRALCLLVPSP